MLAVVLLPGCDCAAVEAGVAFWPNKPPALEAGAAGLAPPKPPPNRPAAGFAVSAGGAPTGVVEPAPPNSGFAGVAWPLAAPVVGVVEPNKPEPPVLPNNPPVVDVLPVPEGAVVVPDPKRLLVVAAGVLVVGAAVVVAGLLPNRLGVPEGVAVPEAGVEVLPNKPPAGLEPPPPNKPPPVEAPVV